MSIKHFWVIVFSVSSLPGHAALITGSFKNALANDPVQVFVPHYYIDGKSDTYRSTLDAQQRFSIAANVPEAQLVFLVYNEERLPIFLAPGDTVLVRADAFTFPIVVSFGGRGGANNSVLKQFLQENKEDYNEFNNLRFKIGQWWASVETPMNGRMEDLAPADFKAALDKEKTAAFALLDDFNQEHPDALTPVFTDWLSAEIVYEWAYHLLFYGHVYGARHSVQPEFFDFLYDAPIFSEQIGSDWYRQFLLALLARQQAKTGKSNNFWAGQYQMAGDLLSGKALAFFRSEMILIAFSTEHYNEILPLFKDFLQRNTVPGYDEKVAELYQKFARVSPGGPAPAFSGKDAAGKTISLAQFRGKVVYLNFWASWCGACLKKMEFFNGFASEFENQGIEIVNISIDENPANWQSTLEERHFKGFQLLASHSDTRDIAVAYGVEAVPQYFIVNKDGSFAEKAYSSQPDDIRKRLLELAKPR